MKATELRIGNYFIPPNTGTIESTTVMYLGLKQGIEIFINSHKSSECAPIELTGDWLLKFGFEKDKKLPVFTKRTKVKDNFIIGNPEMVLICNPHQRIIWIESNTTHIKCAYVHQLQNLYFALTGKELIKKE